jgi:hypothetical protein
MHEVTCGAVVLGDAENDRVIRVLPADHPEGEERGEQKYVAAKSTPGA